jgi:molybdopterin synthase sulfur carrier subunit
MQLQLKTFGVTRELLGDRQVTWDFRGTTVGELKTELVARYPALAGLGSLQLAVNQCFADDDRVLSASDEIALIPPMSGG